MIEDAYHNEVDILWIPGLATSLAEEVRQGCLQLICTYSYVQLNERQGSFLGG